MTARDFCSTKRKDNIENSTMSYLIKVLDSGQKQPQLLNAVSLLDASSLSDLIADYLLNNNVGYLVPRLGLGGGDEASLPL